MPWKVSTTMSQRQEFISFCLQDDSNMSELCRRYNISRKTGYKWIKRYLEGFGLDDKSRKPHTSPYQTSKAMTQKILQIRDTNPAWGARKIQNRLLRLGYSQIPSPSTITALLKRHHRLMPDPHKQQHPYIRFEHPHPNDLWQMDFKGHFPTDLQTCHPLTVLDDHSRYNLCLQSCANQKTLTVKQHLTNTFRTYGLPLAMTMDNGSPWGSDATYTFTPLTLWLMRLGIRVSHSRPYHPQTQGKNERFHRSLKAEVLAYQHFKDLNHCQKHFDQWRYIYNHERPHEALDFKTPIERYKASKRSFPETLPSIEYDSSDIIRKVCQRGCVSFKNKQFRVGKPFRGHSVAIRYTTTDGVFDVFFCRTRIKKINFKS